MGTYNYLHHAIKVKIIEELRESFSRHPQYSKVDVLTKYPVEQRPQYAVILKNQSSSTKQLASDNHLGTLQSHVGFANVQNHPGVSIEWVKENQQQITTVHRLEDISNLMLDGSDDPGATKLPNGRRVFLKLPAPIVKSERDLSITRSVYDVRVAVNEIPSEVVSVNGLTGLVKLKQAPTLGATIQATWVTRSLADSGLYYLTLEDEDGNPSSTKFMLDYIKLVQDEVLVEDATDGQTTATLSHIPINGTIHLYRFNQVILPTSQYTVDYSTGEITFDPPLDEGVRIVAAYRHYASSTGPFTIVQNEINVDAIPGVVLAFGRRVAPGDKIVIIITDSRSEKALVQGGRWIFSLGLDVLAQDQESQAEITDEVVRAIWMEKKGKLDAEGITITGISPGSDSTDIYDEVAGLLWWMSSIEINIETDWEHYVPIPVPISGFEYLEVPGGIAHLTPEKPSEFSSEALSDDDVAIWPPSMKVVDRIPTPNFRKPVPERII